MSKKKLSIIIVSAAAVVAIAVVAVIIGVNCGSSDGGTAPQNGGQGVTTNGGDGRNGEATTNNSAIGTWETAEMSGQVQRFEFNADGTGNREIVQEGFDILFGLRWAEENRRITVIIDDVNQPLFEMLIPEEPLILEHQIINGAEVLVLGDIEFRRIELNNNDNSEE